MKALGALPEAEMRGRRSPPPPGTCGARPQGADGTSSGHSPKPSQFLPLADRYTNKYYRHRIAGSNVVQGFVAMVTLLAGLAMGVVVALIAPSLVPQHQRGALIDSALRVV